MDWGYCSGVPTAVEAWRTCPRWELTPSHPHFVRVDLSTRGFVFLFSFVFIVNRDTVLSFSTFCAFLLSVPVQLIAWKDLSPK